MRRLTIASLILGVVAWTAGEGIAGKGNGNGNGGGGGGGGGGGPTPAGRIYFGHDTGPSTVMQSMLADGTDVVNETVAGIPVDAGEHLSYERHGAAGDEVYWTLATKVTAPVANPDDSEQNVLVARRDGVEVELTTVAPGGERITAVRWGKDDAFVSFVSIRWTGAGADDAAAHVYTAGVSWATGEPALTETPVQEFEVPSFLNPNNEAGGTPTMEAQVAFFDWSPDGGEIAYELDGSIWVRDLSAAPPSSSVRAGTGPKWSPDGGSIAFVDDGLWTMDPDGTNATELVADSRKDTVFDADWSPDGADLAFTIGKQRRGSIPSGLATVDLDIARVAASGGGVVRLTDDGDSDDRLAGWRAD